MSGEAQIKTGAVHHATLTVTDVQRTSQLFTSALGFQVAAELGPPVLLSNGSVIIALAPAASGDDRFDENRAGLDTSASASPVAPISTGRCASSTRTASRTAK